MGDIDCVFLVKRQELKHSNEREQIVQAGDWISLSSLDS